MVRCHLMRHKARHLVLRIKDCLPSCILSGAKSLRLSKIVRADDEGEDEGDIWRLSGAEKDCG